MTAYVDSIYTEWRGKRWYHLMADTVGELHNIAGSIGLRPNWFQNGTLPHYDITEHYRNKAIQAGAVELDRAGVVALIRRYREQANE